MVASYNYYLTFSYNYYLAIKAYLLGASTTKYNIFYIFNVTLKWMKWNY